jgi:hypothetical protein
MEIFNSMIDEMWRTETIRVGNAEITVERDIDTGELKEESEHLVVFKDGTRFTAYGAEEIKTFVKDILLLPETDTLFRNTNQAIKLAKRIKWIS